MKHSKKQTKNAGKARKAPKTSSSASAPKAPRARNRDPRLPVAGTTIVRPYKGKELRVTVLEEGFRHEGKEYHSLSALASEVTGAASINGYLFFKLTGGKPAAPKAARSKASAAKDDATESTPVAEFGTA